MRALGDRLYRRCGKRAALVSRCNAADDAAVEFERLGVVDASIRDRATSAVAVALKASTTPTAAACTLAVRRLTFEIGYKQK